MPLVQVTLIAGRSDAQKEKIMREITDSVEQTLDVPRAIVRVIIQEVPASHWAVGGVPVTLPPSS